VPKQKKHAESTERSGRELLSVTAEYAVFAVVQMGMTMDKLTDTVMPFYCLVQLHKEQMQHQCVQQLRQWIVRYGQQYMHECTELQHHVCRLYQDCNRLDMAAVKPLAA